MSLITLNGYDLIFGKSFDSKNPFGDTKKSLFGDKDSETTDKAENITAEKSEENPEDTNSEENPEAVKTKKDESFKPHPFIIILEILALVGLIMALRNSKTNWLIAIIVTQIICLVVTIAVINLQLGKYSGKEGEAFKIILKLGYEIGFWLTALALVGLFVYNIYLKVNAAKQAPELAPIAPEINDTPPLS